MKISNRLLILVLCGLSGLPSLVVLPAQSAPRLSATASLIFINGKIWTVDDRTPKAEAVAISANTIMALGSNSSILRLRRAHTQVIDLHDALMLPGFIDAHTHFGNAVDAFYSARTVDVSDESKLDQRLREAAARVPDGLWITGFELDSVTAAKAARQKLFHTAFVPDLAAVDTASGNHPVLLRRYDGAYFANSIALKLGRITPLSPDPPNGEYVKDLQTRQLTGLILGSAGPRFAAMLPPASRAHAAIAAQAIVQNLNALGITGIDDIARIDALSQRQTFPVDVERSFTNMDVFEDLRSAGKLTLRVYPILSLSEWRDYARIGIHPGSGDDLIHYGALKAFMDASFMAEPFDNANGWRGDFSYRVTDPQKLNDDMVGAARFGFDLAVHVMGDEGHKILLDDYAAAAAVAPGKDHRFRLLHMWYPTFDQITRAGHAHDIADISPYQLIDQLGSIDAALGQRRAASAFAWHSALQAGIRLDIGSDWPGAFDGSQVYPVDPLENIYYAVTRRPLGAVTGGWHMGEALTVDEAIKAYTLSPAYAERAEARKGSITPRKLADMVVLSRDIRNVAADDIPKARVLYTVFNGRIVYQGSPPQTP